MEVDQGLLDQLVAMGFPVVLAAKVLTSGNSSLEDAINWIIDHENDVVANEPPTFEALMDISIEAPDSFNVSERVELKAQELRNQACRKKAEQEKKLEREMEKERIRAGKELLEAKRMAEESERKRFLSQRKAEKEEDKRARERIRQKLQQDKLERRGILGLPALPPQATKNEQSVDADFLPVKPTSMRECLRSLKQKHKDDNSKATRALQTLFIYVKNIVNNPEEEKFRCIRMSNPVFLDRVGRFEECMEFLKLCGFERAKGGDFLLLPREKVSMQVLKFAGNELQNALTNPFFGLLSA